MLAYCKHVMMMLDLVAYPYELWPVVLTVVVAAKLRQPRPG